MKICGVLVLLGGGGGIYLDTERFGKIILQRHLRRQGALHHLQGHAGAFGNYFVAVVFSVKPRIYSGRSETVHFLGDLKSRVEGP